ncbi:FliI/YscN family ATPase [Congregibacter litoralis]|uniref:Flagellum-specific ATP synthase n=1 Tax=Congregibacter litoralis KT71 TaxID=314285 RepID=A4A5Z3_9GAMM|nr:FliI/YscN family ATPase [Congregibacter litoralis]EAQ98440.1 ATPase FliI/YscN family [Congregibacter litoralis KT71]
MSSGLTHRQLQQQRVGQRLHTLAAHVHAPKLLCEGRLMRMVGMKLEAEGCDGAIGERCRVVSGSTVVDTEIVGFAEGRLVLMPEGDVSGLQLGARVQPLGERATVAVDEQLFGRVIDGAGRYLDGGPAPHCSHSVALRAKALNPLDRRPIREPLDVGVRAINAFLTMGKGQRLGLFAGSGVGKSTLLGMMTRHTEADVIVVGLVGERGREVREFIEDILGPQGLARAIVVATPADYPPLMRVHGAWRATAIAEYFRDQGRDVLLLMDSLTRFAQAQREIGLAVGEPPVSKGYPPSVFSLLPNLVERAGNGPEGSITAVYTVLVEGDDHNDPIADAARAILDGHIVLSRQVADSGLFPAIDLEASVSRAMPGIADEGQQDLARALKELYSVYRQNRDLISIGAYEHGSDPKIDQALRAHEPLRQIIRQPQHQKVDMAQSLGDLQNTARHLGNGTAAG